MVKSYTKKNNVSLVIVESPAKCKTIESYLGPGYKCVASFGHFRELAKLTNIDIQNNFSLTYEMMEEKKKQITLIGNMIKKVDEVILATDDDREGESIAWHICDYFKLNVATTKRIIFHEITESALQHAIHNPTTVNMNIVNAQKARQVLDLLVGFKITPTLWKCIGEKSLSAGRCQTPALRIIYDNQQEINAAPGETVYNTVGYFTNKNIPFELNKQFTSEDELTNFLNRTAGFSHSYNCSKPTKVVKTAPAPFTTSRLQQVASNELRFSPRETMKTCQTLYEGGFITYMRTDSTNYCDEFLKAAQEYIMSVYNDDRYIKEGGREQTTGGHEAIRVTKICMKELPETMDKREKRMYNLIWTNTVASCMADAVYMSVTATVSGVQNTKFTRTAEQQLFAGFTPFLFENAHSGAFSSAKSNGSMRIFDAQRCKLIKADSNNNDEYQYLQIIDKVSPIQYKKVTCSQTIKNAKLHYTEARLVQLLEEKGIGRPSTFAMLVDKIQERGYVKKTDIEGREIDCNDFELQGNEICKVVTKRTFGKEHGKLIIQPIGTIVSEFLEQHFADIFNYGYTREMEVSLDKISAGLISTSSLCNQCNDQLDLLINFESKLQLKNDDNKNESSYNLGKFEQDDVILKTGKYGLYITWGTNRKALKELGKRPMDSITLEDVEQYLNKGSNIIRNITEFLSIRKSARGDYIYYKSAKMRKPSFHSLFGFDQDYKMCDLDILKSWIREKHDI